MNILNMDRSLRDAFAAVLPVENSIEPYRLGVRPENIEVSGESGLAVKVETIEYLGADTLLMCRSLEQEIVVSVSGMSDVRVGDQVKLNWESKHIHLFSLATGQRLEY